jgi:hypothetical protein
LWISNAPPMMKTGRRYWTAPEKRDAYSSNLNRALKLL